MCSPGQRHRSEATSLKPSGSNHEAGSGGARGPTSSMASSPSAQPLPWRRARRGRARGRPAD
eukprot:6747890-Pyramimonas_sp.AAC.1